jgi:hypothetical protein
MTPKIMRWKATGRAPGRDGGISSRSRPVFLNGITFGSSAYVICCGCLQPKTPERWSVFDFVYKGTGAGQGPSSFVAKCEVHHLFESFGCDVLNPIAGELFLNRKHCSLFTHAHFFLFRCR